MKKNTKPAIQIHILEASAGSGKTYALAKRYLKLIINPSLKPHEIAVKNILAITFTNKASIEMKTRIFEFLKKIALDSFSKDAERADILRSLGVPEIEARQKAFALMEYIVKNYSRFRIQTVDSFINEIISGSSFRLNLSSRFDIRTDSGDYLSRSLDTIIASSEQSENIGEALKEFVAQYLYIENKSGWLPQKNILTVVSDMYSKANTYGGSFVKVLDIPSKEIFALKKSIFEQMKQLYEALPEKTNKSFKDKLTKIITETGDSISISSLGKYFQREELPLNKGCQASEKCEKLWVELKDNIVSLSKAEAFSFYNCYINLYDIIIKYFEKLSQKDDIMFLGELNRRANAVFVSGQDPVPELYYRMSARFSHFLIDEFQDTSVIQWKNIMPMAEEVLSNGGSLFYVGDKKQAIYRFRGGDAELFDSVPGSFPLISNNIEVLKRNYRSRSEIVNYNNSLFSAENIGRFVADFGAEDEEKQFEKSDTAEILKIYSGSFQNTGDENSGGHVSVKYIDAKNNDERDSFMKAELVARVKEAGGRYPYKDIAVLARQNDDVELFTGWLLEEQIPAESEKTLNLKENIIIKEFVSLLTFLNSPIDNAAFASFLLGDIFANNSKLDKAEIEKFIFKTGTGAGSKLYLYKVFRDEYPELWGSYFEEFFISTGFMPVYELAVSILGKFSVPTKFPGHQGFVSHFLELIKDNEKEHRSLKAFIEYFNDAPDKDMFVRFSGADSVRLMTIHKAKGLEFPVVIIPYLEMEVSALEGKGPSGSYFLNKTEKGLSLVKLNKDYAAYSPELRRLYSDNLKKSLIDELNAVYVALTRAKDELYVYIPAKSGSKKNAARLLCGDELVAGVQISKAKATAVKSANLNGAVYGDWIKIIKDEFSGNTRAEKRDAAVAGEALHYGLSLIGNMSETRGERHLESALRKMKARFQTISNIDDITALFIRTVKNAAFAEIFYLKDVQVLNEQEIIDKTGATKRVDRLIIHKDSVVVADYKSSREGEESHKSQLKYYMEIIREIYPKKTIEGRLVYLDSMTLESII